ncbi:MAG: AAA family ATPase [Acidimicrobiia bacterium]|nr:AAA family ATPase [Acidimicrobiia bacterium]
MDLGLIGGSKVVGRTGDVAQIREAGRRRRLIRTLLILALVIDYPLARYLGGQPVHFSMPAIPQQWQEMLPSFILISVLCAVLLVPMMMMGRSPHTVYRPSEITVGLDDVVGLGMVKDEVIKTLNLFLGYRTFRDRMGGNPRRAILFEGPPGTGKTYMAKAMAREAGVPFHFIAASSIQSPYFGQTNRKIAKFFKQLRKAARREGGAIGFIEEIDAIGVSRAGMNQPEARHDSHDARTIYRGLGEGFAGVINELLIQLQSFDEPTAGEKFIGWCLGRVNWVLPARWEIRKKPPASSNILVIGATNRASALDPALLRPGRFDRSIHFDLPSRSGRREIIDFYLNRKAHVPELDKEERREQLAAVTIGYSPVMIEHLFDEALIWSLRAGRESMEWDDIQQAKLTEEIGLANPVEYTDEERRIIATHEAGHAVVAHLVGVGRKLEVLSIIRRAGSLGLLAHSDTEERFLRNRTEMLSHIQIAFGGMVAEELWFGESGTGPGSDLAHATTVAATMVGALGLAGSLVSFSAAGGGPLDAGLVPRVLADDAARREVESILDRSKASVKELLDANRHLVEALRDELLEHNEIVGDEITAALHEAGMAQTITGSE